LAVAKITRNDMTKDMRDDRQQCYKTGKECKYGCDCDYYTYMMLNGQKVCSNCEKIKAEAEKLIE